MVVELLKTAKIKLTGLTVHIVYFYVSFKYYSTFSNILLSCGLEILKSFLKE